MKRYYLQPGEEVVQPNLPLVIGANKQQIESLGRGGADAACAPGVYFVRAILNIPNATSTLLPAQPEDWRGTLETGKHKLVVTGEVE